MSKRDFATEVRPLLEQQLAPDEQLEGIVAATHQTTFSGRLIAIGVTDQRLILQPVDRKMRPKDEAVSILPDELASADADGAGGGWWTATAAIMDNYALTVKLGTTNGRHWKLIMMRGGDGMMGKLGGGEQQEQSIVKLAEWIGAALG